MPRMHQFLSVTNFMFIVYDSPLIAELGETTASFFSFVRIYIFRI